MKSSEPSLLEGALPDSLPPIRSSKLELTMSSWKEVAKLRRLPGPASPSIPTGPEYYNNWGCWSKQRRSRIRWRTVRRTGGLMDLLFNGRIYGDSFVKSAFNLTCEKPR